MPAGADDGTAVSLALVEGVNRALLALGGRGCDMHEMFDRERRDANPPPSLEPWSGGYAGLHLAAGAASYATVPDPALKDALDRAVQRLLSHRTRGGYIGPWPSTHEFKRDAPNAETPWDIWGHHHIVYGALAWHRVSGSHFALDLAMSVGDGLLRRFGSDPSSIHALGVQHTSLVLAGTFALLHEVTDADKYLEGVKTVLKFNEMPGSCGFFGMRKAGARLLKASPTCRGWEALRAIEALALVGRAAPVEIGGECRDAATAFWWELCEGARAANGGVALPDPSAPSTQPSDPPRTLATHAWVRLTAAVLSLLGGEEGECAAADELELAVVNAAAFAAGRTRQCADEVPVDGGADRRESELDHTHVCSLDLLPAAAACAFAAKGDALTVHLFHAATHVATLPSGGTVRVAVDTQHPHDRVVRVTVRPQRRGERFTLRLRVPQWAEGATAEVDLTTAGQPEHHTPRVGDYFELNMAWRPGDTVTLDLNPTLRFRRADAGKSMFHLYHGPILLVAAKPASFAASKVRVAVSRVAVKRGGGLATVVRVLNAKDGSLVTELHPYSRAGLGDGKVVSSFKVPDLGRRSSAVGGGGFSRDNTLGAFAVPGLEVSEVEDGSTDGHAVALETMAIVRSRASSPYSRVVAEALPRTRARGVVAAVAAAEAEAEIAKARAQAAPAAQAQAQASGERQPQFADMIVDQERRAANVGGDGGASNAKSASSSPGKYPFAGRSPTKGTSAAASPAKGAATASSPAKGASAAASPAKGAAAEPAEPAAASEPVAEPAAERAAPAPVTARASDMDVHRQKELQELQEARNMQAELRRIKADMEAKAATVATSAPAAKESPKPARQPAAAAAAAAAAAPAPAAPSAVANPHFERSATPKSDAGSAPATPAKAGKAAPSPAKSGGGSPGAKPASCKGQRKSSGVAAPAKSAGANPFSGGGGRSGGGGGGGGLGVGGGAVAAKSATLPSRPMPANENSCVACSKTAYPMERLTADGATFHKKCFRCTQCTRMLGLGNYAALEGDLFCKPCFKKMFRLKGNYSEGFGKEQHKMKWIRGETGGSASAGGGGSGGSGDAEPPQPDAGVPALVRKRSTRDMLSSALDKDAPVSPNAGEGYELASGEEVAESADAKDKRFQQNPEGVAPKSSWKQSWKKLLSSGKSKQKKKAAKAGAVGVGITNPNSPFAGGAGGGGGGGPTRKGSRTWQPPATDKCVLCSHAVYPMEKLQADGAVYHKKCFRCAKCDKALGLGNYAALEGDMFCKPCFKKMFKLKGNYSEGFGKEQHKMKWLKDGAAGTL